jgi:hypothetical protein
MFKTATSNVRSATKFWHIYSSSRMPTGNLIAFNWQPLLVVIHQLALLITDLDDVPPQIKNGKTTLYL